MLTKCHMNKYLSVLLASVQVNDELCQLMGVQCKVTSAYHTQTNGLDGMFNQTLQHQLLKYVDEDQSTWDLYLNAILFSYRVARQDSTKMPPFVPVYNVCQTGLTFTRAHPEGCKKRRRRRREQKMLRV